MNFRNFLAGSLCALAVAGSAINFVPVNALSATALQNGIPSLAPILREVTPAVVSIRVSQSVDGWQSFDFKGEIPPQLQRFFQFREDSPRFQEPPPQVLRQGAGSGVIIDADAGLIVTNQHVIDHAEQIDITLEDGRRFAAELVGSDEATDIALLKINGENLVALEFADSDSAEIGDFVVAIGNPFAIGQTVTAGIISALGRSGLDNDKYEDFIQTDAAINVGNSGGALVDMEGRLMGINTAIISSNGGGSAGIGFAVPANMVAAVVEHLERDGEVRRGMLGIQIGSVTSELARTLDLEVDQGALVTGVLPGSAAEAAGIELYDVIVGIDGKPVSNSRTLRNYVGLLRQGQPVKVNLVRNGTERELTAMIGNTTGLAATESATPGQPGSFAGARLRDAGSRSNDLSGGVEVVEVAPRSRAWQAGLREGDVITEVNRRAVDDVDAFLSETGDDAGMMAFTVLRDGRPVLILMP